MRCNSNAGLSQPSALGSQRANNQPSQDFLIPLRADMKLKPRNVMKKLLNPRWVPLILAMGLAADANAALSYFDSNGGSTGAGTPSVGTATAWGGSVWNSNSSGTGTPAAWTAGDDAVFSA